MGSITTTHHFMLEVAVGFGPTVKVLQTYVLATSLRHRVVGRLGLEPRTNRL